MLYAFRDEDAIVVIAASNTDEYLAFIADVEAGKFPMFAEADAMDILFKESYFDLRHVPMVARFGDDAAETAFCMEHRLIVTGEQKARGKMTLMRRIGANSLMSEDAEFEMGGWDIAMESSYVDEQAERAKQRQMKSDFKAAEESGAIKGDSFKKKDNGFMVWASMFGATVPENSEETETYMPEVQTSQDRIRYDITFDDLVKVEIAFRHAGIDFARANIGDGVLTVDLGEFDSIAIAETLTHHGVVHTISLNPEQIGTGADSSKSALFRSAEKMLGDLSLDAQTLGAGDFVFCALAPANGSPPRVAVTSSAYYAEHGRIYDGFIAEIVEPFLPEGLSEIDRGVFEYRAGSSRAADRAMLEAGFSRAPDFFEKVYGVAPLGSYHDTGIELLEGTGEDFLFEVIDGLRTSRVVIVPSRAYGLLPTIDFEIHPIVCHLIPTDWTEIEPTVFEAKHDNIHGVMDTLVKNGFGKLDDFSRYVRERFSSDGPAPRSTRRYIRRAEAAEMLSNAGLETDLDDLGNKALEAELRAKSLVDGPFSVIDDHASSGDDTAIGGGATKGQYFRLNVHDTSLSAISTIFLTGNIDLSLAASDTRDTDSGCWIAFIRQDLALEAETMLKDFGFRCSVDTVDETGNGIGDGFENTDYIIDPRPWNDRAEQYERLSMEERARIKGEISGREFYFSCRHDADRGNVLTIVPVSYFDAHDELWDGVIDIIDLLPPATKRAGPYTFVNRGIPHEHFLSLIGDAGFVDNLMLDLHLNSL